MNESSYLAKHRDYLKRCRQSPGCHQRLLETQRRGNLRLKLKRRGLTPAAYAGMLDKIGGLCEVCRQPPGGRLLDLDHDHVTGKVRGLLCNRCNQALGLLNDSAEAIRSLLDYRTRFDD